MINTQGGGRASPLCAFSKKSLHSVKGADEYLARAGNDYLVKIGTFYLVKGSPFYLVKAQNDNFQHF